MAIAITDQGKGGDALEIAQQVNLGAGGVGSDNIGALFERAVILAGKIPPPWPVEPTIPQCIMKISGLLGENKPVCISGTQGKIIDFTVIPLGKDRLNRKLCRVAPAEMQN